MKKFLIIQIRPEDEAADNELESFLKFGGLSPDQILRIQADRNPIPSLNTDDFSGIIIGGGPANISDAGKEPDMIRMDSDIQKLIGQAVKKGTPLLGACYGIGALCAYLGGTVSKEKYSEPVGATTIKLTADGQKDPLLSGIPREFRAFGGHKEACQNLPPGAVLLAGSDACPIQIIKFNSNIYATQFHPELDTAGIIVRINVYKHAGYFPPGDANKLIAQVRKETVTIPIKILGNFVKKYRQG